MPIFNVLWTHGGPTDPVAASLSCHLNRMTGVWSETDFDMRCMRRSSWSAAMAHATRLLPVAGGRRLQIQMVIPIRHGLTRKRVFVVERAWNMTADHTPKPDHPDHIVPLNLNPDDQVLRQTRGNAKAHPRFDYSPPESHIQSTPHRQSRTPHQERPVLRRKVNWGPGRLSAAY